MTYKPFDLTGRVALVTGGNGGIGLGMAEALAHAGADVAIWGTNADKNRAAETTLKAAGRRVLVYDRRRMRGAAVADAPGAGDVVAQLNTLLARLRTHGLIAT